MSPQAMTAISVIFGVAFKQVPEAFSTTIPVAEYIGVALLLYFGVRSLRDAWNMPAESSNDEFVEATETVDNVSLKPRTNCCHVKQLS